MGLTLNRGTDIARYALRQRSGRWLLRRAHQLPGLCRCDNSSSSNLAPMSNHNNAATAVFVDLAKVTSGAIAGAAAWWAMDQVLSYLYDHEGEEVQRIESEARRGVPALEVMAESIAALSGTSLSVEERMRAGTVLQWAIGISTGLLYGAVRDRMPGPGISRGLLYGAAVSLLFDEGAIPLLGFAPGPAALPWQTHARGFIGHLVYGAVAESVMVGFERIGR